MSHNYEVSTYAYVKPSTQ